MFVAEVKATRTQELPLVAATIFTDVVKRKQRRQADYTHGCLIGGFFDLRPRPPCPCIDCWETPSLSSCLRVVLVGGVRR